MPTLYFCRAHPKLAWLTSAILIIVLLKGPLKSTGESVQLSAATLNVEESDLWKIQMLLSTHSNSEEQ